MASASEEYDISRPPPYGLPRSAFGTADARLGLRGQVRTLDGFSEGYVMDPARPRTLGTEAEVLSYIEVRL